MDKSELLSYLRQGTISSEMVTKILYDYCVEEHKKDSSMTNMFIKLLLSVGQANSYLTEAVNYYKKKFTICEITRLKDNQLLYVY